jgi:hypothetical protein
LAGPNYKLTTWDEQDTHYVQISSEEFQEIKLAKANLLEAMFIEEKMDLVIENYLEFENDILASSARHMVQYDFSYLSAQVDRNLFARRLMNLLSACKAYLDQTAHHLSNIFGKDSQAAGQFIKSTNDRYDNCLGYRIMEALRNYAQHRAFPLHAIDRGSKWVKSESGQKLMFYTRPLMYLRELVDDDKFKKAVLAELKKIGQEIDLQPHVRDYIASLGTVHQELRNILRSPIGNWENIISSSMERFRTAHPEEYSVAGERILAMSEADYIWLFKDFIDNRRTLAQKNQNLSSLTDRYVTNEIVVKK